MSRPPAPRPATQLADEPAEAPLQRPAVVELDDAPEADPGLAPPPPEALPDPATLPPRLQARARSGSALNRFALWSLSALLSFVLSVAAYDFVTGLFAAQSALGWVALVLTGLAVAALLLLALREVLALARMGRIEGLRQRAAQARARDNLREARAVVADLARLYARRPDLSAALAGLAAREGEVLDAAGLLAQAETALMAPLDAAALTEVEASAAQVATVTALVPLALADVATALFANLRLIRRLADIYGGRSSLFGNLALLRRVFAALLGAGAMALADDLVGSFASGGVLGRLSRRFGEGVVNGALAARVGLAAMEACRPLPFVALDRPGTSATVARALRGLVPVGRD